MFFLKLIDSISNCLGKIAAFLILPMIMFVVYSSFKRYIVGSMPVWGYEVPIFLYGVSSILGGCYCHKNKKHVNIDIISKYLSSAQYRKLSVLSELVVFTCCFIVAYYAVSWAWDSTLLRERSIHQTEFNPEIWWFKWMIPVGFFSIALQALRNILKKQDLSVNS